MTLVTRGVSLFWISDVLDTLSGMHMLVPLLVHTALLQGPALDISQPCFDPV